MTLYDFKTLSPYDFECLVRDLLQEELGVTLESFKSGRDSGIDLRYSREPNQNHIVQCKHFAESGYKVLYRHLKNMELKKVIKLKPSRYSITTSVALTVKQKDEILNLFKTFCISTADIYGKDDLNNLLGKFPSIEKKHFKLWLTSQSVLQWILHSKIFNQTELDLERIQRRIKTYVENDSFNRAKQILEESHHCIIAGIPGIGKTMLAEILLIEYSQRGFEPIVVINDISEAITTYSKGHRQIYYYDDFLGQTGLGEKFNKNEEKSLVKFMKEIRNTKNTRLILTTREYILEQAKSTYEVLDLATPELINCTIDLEDYTRYHRAKILYNHLYFSKLPKQFKIAILENNSFLKIIDHKNFNPRIIDIMTDQFLRFTKDHKIFVQKFIENLDNPSRIWLHAFENQISHASRYLLLSLFSLPEEVMLDDAQRAFNSFCDNNAKQNGFHIEQNAFKKAIKELDGTFIKTERVLRGTLISLHNPSVRDFLRYFLAENDAIYRSLCDSLIFYDQCINLWGTSRQTETTTELRILALKNLDVFTSALVRTFKSDSCLLDVYRHGDRKNPLVLKPQTSLENRFLFVLNLFNAINDKRISSVTGSLLNIIIDNIKSGHANGELLHEIINKIPRDKDCAGLPRTQLIEVMRNFLRSKLDSLEDIMNYTRFAIVLKAKGDKSDFQNAKDCFRSFYKNATEREIENRDNADSLRIFAENLEETGDMLSVDVSEEVGYLNSVADGFEEDRLDHEDIYSDSPHIVEQAPQYSDEDIKTLFETLI